MDKIACDKIFDIKPMINCVTYCSYLPITREWHFFTRSKLVVGSCVTCQHFSFEHVLNIIHLFWLCSVLSLCEVNHPDEKTDKTIPFYYILIFPSNWTFQETVLLGQKVISHIYLSLGEWILNVVFVLFGFCNISILFIKTF